MEDWGFVVFVLAPSAILAAAAATLKFQNEILPSQFHQLGDLCGRDAGLDIWSESDNVPEPAYPA